MDQRLQLKLLQERGIELSPDETRDVTEIGLQFGVLKLVSAGIEQTGIFNESDFITERRHGRILQSVGFGVEVFEVVDAREVEAQDGTTDDKSVQ